MAELSYAEFDDAEVRTFLKGMNEKLKEIKDGKKKYTGLLSAIIYRDVMDHFTKQEGPQGAWPAWSKIYKEYAKAHGKSESKNMLKWTGKLRNAFKPTNVKSSKDGPIWFNNARTSEGFPYAFHHDEGAKKKRPFMWASDQAIESISVQTLAFMLDEGL